ncbi:hypothetical protein LEMLEM_LOCUS12441, partial [Lemmus lemmus]
MCAPPPPGQCLFLTTPNLPHRPEGKTSRHGHHERTPGVSTMAAEAGQRQLADLADHTILRILYGGGQKRAPDLITDGCEPPCGCWELNSGPSEKQAMLLTAE